MSSTNAKKDTDRLSVMIPRDCKSDIEYIISQTGIKSNGELFRLMLARYREDFVSAYNQFFTPTTVQASQSTEAETKPIVTATTSKPLTSAMDF